MPNNPIIVCTTEPLRRRAKYAVLILMSLPMSASLYAYMLTCSMKKARIKVRAMPSRPFAFV
jgi:hypothetical protein